MNHSIYQPITRLTKIIVLGIFLLIGNISFGQADSSSTPYPLVPGRSGGFYLNDPSNFGSNVKYNPLTGNYEIVNTIGGKPVGTPTILSPEEYRNRAFGDQLKNYWDNKNEEQANNVGEDKSPEVAGGIIPDIEMGGETFDKIFGSNIVKIRPNGTAELIFAGVINRQDNPIIPERNRRTTSFQFDQKIQMNVVGQIGDKLRLQTNYDTENTFQFENRMKLEYTGSEDEIIKKVELGNVSLPLSGT
ncbi:MAG: cell surface protein SprA, partial [Candidatus Azotimanducaceae bacterium]